MLMCTKRHVICWTLTFPACVYLFLMLAAIGQLCFKSDSDQPQFKEKYLKLLGFFQRSSSYRTVTGDKNRDNVKEARSLLGSEYNKVFSSSHSSVSSDCQVCNEDRMLNRPALLHNCSSISVMKIRSKVGHGVSKQAFIADYRGTHVAIKMVTRHIHEVRNCLEELKRSKIGQKHSLDNTQPLLINRDSFSENTNTVRGVISRKPTFSDGGLQSLKIRRKPSVISPTERQRCFTFPTARLMKEILMSVQLHHHNLARLLGYCVRSEESETTDISEHGVISVYELGSRFVLDNLQILPWPTRLKHAIEMSDLLTYLQNSPLGSLVVPDFKEGHLVMINGSLKLIDLDDVNNLEPECDLKESRNNPCPYNIRCERALCGGFNAKENLKNMNVLVFKRLLFPLTFPQSVMAEIGQLNAELDSLTLTADDLKRKLIEIKAFLVKE